MPFPIQRVPQGLGQLLSSFGGQTPQALADQIFGVVELLQFYGLQQRVTLTNSAAGVASSTTTAQATVTPSATQWSVLFSIHTTVLVLAGTTEVGFGCTITRPSGSVIVLECKDIVPVVGSRLCVTFAARFPIMLPPGSQVGVLLYSTLGSATQDVAVTCDVGLLG